MNKSNPVSFTLTNWFEVLDFDEAAPSSFPVLAAFSHIPPLSSVTEPGCALEEPQTLESQPGKGSANPSDPTVLATR